MTLARGWIWLLAGASILTVSGMTQAKAADVEQLEAQMRAMQAQLRELGPRIGDLRDRAEQAEKEAKRLAKEWRGKREPALAALGELKTGAEKAWGELKTALDSAIAKFREPS